MPATYSIGTLAGLTGLSQHTIRAWERRYKAVEPSRGETNRRSYTQADADRLILLRRLVEEGHSIGHVANEPNASLIELLTGPRALANTGDRANSSSDSLLRNALDAIGHLDPERLESVLSRGYAELGVLEFLNRLVVPLLASVGERWAEGSLRISQEHMASAVLRSFLQRVRNSIPTTTSAPRLLVATPKGQHHELGALMVTIVAVMDGWKVTYLGPNLPAVEISVAVQMSAASAIGLSLIYPVEDAHLADEFRILRAEVGPRLPILVGGSGSYYFRDVLAEVGAHVCLDLAHFRQALSEIALY